MLDSTINTSDVKSKYPLDPLDLITSKFTPGRILFYENGFVVATGTYENRPDTIACRWHTPGTIGYPSSFGKPQWMRLGNLTLRNAESVFSSDLTQQQLKLSFIKADSTVGVGSWVRYQHRWYLVCMLSPNTTDDIAICKSSDRRHQVPINLADVKEVVTKEISFLKWHRELTQQDGHAGKYLAWLNSEGILFTTKHCKNVNVGAVVERSTYQPTLTGELTPTNRETLVYGDSLNGDYLLGTIDITSNYRKDLLHLYEKKLPIISKHLLDPNDHRLNVESRSFYVDCEYLILHDPIAVNYYQVN